MGYEVFHAALTENEEKLFKLTLAFVVKDRLERFVNNQFSPVIKRCQMLSEGEAQNVHPHWKRSARNKLQELDAIIEEETENLNEEDTNSFNQSLKDNLTELMNATEEASRIDVANCVHWGHREGYVPMENFNSILQLSLGENINLGRFLVSLSFMTNSICYSGFYYNRECITRPYMDEFFKMLTKSNNLQIIRYDEGLGEWIRRGFMEAQIHGTGDSQSQRGASVKSSRTDPTILAGIVGAAATLMSVGFIVYHKFFM